MVGLFTFASTPAMAANIVGGSDAEPDAFLDVVALVLDGNVVCTGTLIADDVVLTAGHCLPNLSAPEARAVVGVHAWRDSPGVALGERAKHPLEEGGLDVAWIRLAETVDVAPRPVASGTMEEAVYPGAPVILAGFGTLDTAGQTPSRSLQVAASTIELDTCDTPLRGCRTWETTPVELLAGGEGVDACVGDSGGPLFGEEGLADVLVGVTSRSALGSTTSCGDGGIYTRIDAVRDWLEADLGPLARAPGQPEAVEPEACGCATGHAPTVFWLWWTAWWTRRRR